MTRVEQEQLVGSYLRGEMSAVEEQEFFIQVALDSDLRQTLKAFRVVETAIRKHREAILPNHAESYQRLMAMLGSSATEPAALIGTATTGMLRQGLGTLGARFFNWTTALVATGALSLGALVLGPAMSGEKDSGPETEPAAVESVLPQTDQGTAEQQLPSQQHAPLRVAQQQREEGVAGTKPDQRGTISPGNTAQKTLSTIDPQAIISEARKKKGAEENQDIFTPPLHQANDGEEGAASSEQASTPRKPKVNFRIINPVEPETDTIDINVKFNPKDIRRKK